MYMYVIDCVASQNEEKLFFTDTLLPVIIVYGTHSHFIGPILIGIIHERLGPTRVGRSCWTRLESDAAIGVRFSCMS